MNSESEFSAHRFLEQMDDAFVALDADWKFVSVNAAALRLIRRPSERLLGKKVWEEFPASIGGHVYRELHRCREGATVVDIEEFVSERERWFGGRCHPWNGGVAVLFSDITAAKREAMRLRDVSDYLRQRVSKRTEELETAEGRFRTVVDNLPALIFLKDLEGRYLMTNPLMQATFPDVSDLTGKSSFDLVPSNLAELFARTDREALETGESVRFEHHLDLADGTHTFAAVKIPIRNAQGDIQAICGFALDITEQRQAESLVRRADRLASLGAIAAGVAHEISNPLSGAWNALQAALNVKDRPEKAELFHRSLNIVANSIQRSRDIVANMLRFGASEVPERTEVDINEAVRRALVLSEALAHKLGARLSFEATVELPTVSANQIQIEQAIVNLVQNAVQAGGNQSGIVVSLRTEAIGEEVVIHVRDNCGGMTEEVRKHAFDLFFTAKKKGGIGLGLAIVHRIITSHGGAVELRALQGKGTEALIRLPAGKPIPESQ